MASRPIDRARAAEIVLDVRGLSCAFGGLRALSDFDLLVHRGDIVGVIGPNGAGKSVFINLVTRFYDTSSGIILYLGRDITRRSIAHVARVGIARTFQNLRLFRRMTVLENVMTANPSSATRPFRASFSERTGDNVTKARQYLELMGLLAVADRKAGTLDYGAARRLEIARALATHPRLLFLDEPAAGMNEEETATLARDIRAAAHLVDAIVLVEHDMALIRALSTRVVALNAGRKICEGSAEDVLGDAEVKAAYLGADAS